MEEDQIRELLKMMDDYANAHSTCLRRKVGAALIINNQIYMGSNTSATGASCIECERLKQNIPSGMQHELCYAVHAEMQCLIHAFQDGNTNLNNAVLLTTTKPCSNCAKLLITAGIKEIYYMYDYTDPINDKLLTKIYCKKVTIDGEQEKQK